MISGQLHVVQCADNQFSPHTSWSNDGYECQYKKSICSEEGQIVVNNGSNTRDVKCRCDYRNGYAYIIKPKNECMCSPSVEDCSCHLVYCQDNISLLSRGNFPFISNYVSTSFIKIVMLKKLTLETDK